MLKSSQIASIEPLMVRAEQAAALCGVSVRTWHSLVAAGQCPPSLKLSGCRLWRVQILRRWTELDCPPIDKFTQILKEPKP